MSQQTKTGRNLRWYANGTAVGITRMKSLKPSRQQKLDAVLEAGNPDVAEYVKHVPETTLALDYNVISVDQLALALGQVVGAEVPDIPDNWDIVEKQIVPGTEGTTTELAAGWTFYQGIMVEKEDWDQEIDKMISVAVSTKARNPRRFPAYNAVTRPNGINGLQPDKLVGNGSTTAFVLTQKAKLLKDGYYTLRVETPIGGIPLKETIDFTVGSTSSTTTLTFTTAPASSTTPNILAWYAY